jgi:hypothetical protein
MEASAYTYKHTHYLRLRVLVYSPLREQKRAPDSYAPARRVNGAKGPGRVVQMHTQGGHSQLYTKSTAQNKLPVYFKFIVLKCEMCMCVFAHRRQPREEAPQGEITTHASSCSLAHCQRAAPGGCEVHNTLSHT